MDLLQRSDRNLGIDLRRLDIFVAEHLLDITDVRPALVHQRCHRVSEEMTGAGLAQLRRVDPLLYREAQMIAAERLTLRCEEHGHVVRLDGKLRSALPDVLLKPCDRPLSDRRISVFLALAVDEDQATIKREIVELELHRFQTPDAGRVQHLQDRPVTQPDNLLIELRDSLRVELRAAPLPKRQVWLRIGRGDPAPFKPQRPRP